MKKLLILATVVVVGVAANAAAFNWFAANIYSSDLTTKYSGEVTLYCAQIADWSVTATAASGVIKAADNLFSSDKFVVGTDYDFYFTIEDGGKMFTSQTVTKGALESQIQPIGFSNMASRTQTEGNWAAVPEPTSGLLLLLGMTSLALKRKRA